MKKILLSILVIVSWFLVIPAFSADRTINMSGGIGLGYNYLYPKDSQIQPFYKGGLAWRGYLELKSDNGLAVSGDIGYFSQGNMTVGSPGGAPFGTALTIIPITGSLSYHFFKDGSISPYLGGGLGIYIIDESDPDFNYLHTTKFGKHIFAGLDIYLPSDTILRFELRDSFIEPVSSSLYYQANLSGLTALVSLAVQWPVAGPEKEMTPEERALAREERLYQAKLQEQQNRLDEMQLYYQQKEWDENLYHRWQSRDVLYNDITITKQQIEDNQAKLDQLKAEQEQKRQQYIEQKLQLRQEKKDSVVPPPAK